MQNQNLPSLNNQPLSSENSLIEYANNAVSAIPANVKALFCQYPTKNRDEVFKSLSEACSHTDQGLALIDKEYGDGVTELWLAVQLIEVLRYTGLTDKFRPYQLEATAKQLREMGYYITMPEFMMFFQRFEQGYYEQFHGYERPNPQVITRSFKLFLSEVLEIRNRVHAKRELDEQALREAEWKEKAVPCPPHVAEKLERFYKNFGK